MKGIFFKVVKIERKKATLRTVYKSDSLIVLNTRNALTNFRTLHKGQLFKLTAQEVKKTRNKRTR